jgi:hypothetical protein
MTGLRHGVTNPGMLFSHGYDFSEGVPAVPEDKNIPEGELLTPADGALVKKSDDPTVFLITGRQKHGFVSASVFTALGYKFSEVLTITAPELDKMPLGDVIKDPAARHPHGVQILFQGTVYWIDGNSRRGYPSQATYNSWNLDNDFTHIVPANAADLVLTEGEIIEKRPICN